MTTKEAASWNEAQWRANLKYASPSKGGAIGVMFCWCRYPSSDGANYDKPGTADFVIKSVFGSAAPAKFAEHFLGKAIGAQGVHTKAIQKGTPVFQAILDRLKHTKDSIKPSDNKMDWKMKRILKTTGQVYDSSTGPKQNPTVVDPLIARWNQVWKYYAGAETLLVQETLQGIQEFGDVYREPNGLVDLLKDKQLMYNMGKLFAADAIIGNGDRLYQPNMGNVIFKADGTICSIDSATLLTNYEALYNGTRQIVGYFEINKPDDWSKQIIGNEIVGRVADAAPTKGQVTAYQNTGETPILPPTFAMNLLFDVNNWWVTIFRPHLTSGFNTTNKKRLENNEAPLAVPSDLTWSTACFIFKMGVEDGIRKIDSLLSGFNWKNIKSKYNKYVIKFGGDPNLDWTNLKVRRLYLKARRRGKSDPQAMALVNDYVKKKYPETTI